MELINAIMAAIWDQADTVILALVPIADGMLNYLSVAAVVFTGLSIWGGVNVMFGPIIRMCVAIGIAKWLLFGWVGFTHMLIEDAHTVIGMMLGVGYAGPAQMLDVASDLAARASQVWVAPEWTSIGDNMAAQAAGLLMPVLIYVGLASAGLMAIVSEVGFVIGCAFVPLLLPWIALSGTAFFGWGGLLFAVRAALRIGILGVNASMWANAVRGVLAIGGTGWMMGHAEVYTLLGLSLLCILTTWSINGIAAELVGGGGGLGFGSIMRTSSGLQSAGSAVSGGVNAAGTASKAAGNAISTASKMASAARGGGGGGAPRGGGTIGRSSGTGSPFGN